MPLFQYASTFGLAAVAALVALHFVATLALRIAGRRPRPAVKPRTVVRYNRWERLVHLVVMIGFLALAVTGFYQAVRGERLSGWLLMAHTSASGLFFVGVLAMVVTWGYDNRFGAAMRFDGWQKAYFWLASVLGLVLLGTIMLSMLRLLDTEGEHLMTEIHRWAALALTAATIVHAYRQTLAKPGALGAILLGRVSPEWAAHHHPQWTSGPVDEGRPAKGV